MKNFLTVVQPEFKDVLKIFRPKSVQKGPVLMSYEGGFLSIESGGSTAVMRAEGEWHGRATFRPEILQALAHVPPTMNPIPISYAENHVLIGSLTIPCLWELQGSSMIYELENPSLLDLVVLERFIPRAELHATERGKQIKSAVRTMERRVANAQKSLLDFGVTEADLKGLVEQKIECRIKAITDSPLIQKK